MSILAPTRICGNFLACSEFGREIFSLSAVVFGVVLEAPSLHGRSEDLGVEHYLIGRAHTNRKPVFGWRPRANMPKFFPVLPISKGKLTCC